MLRYVFTSIALVVFLLAYAYAEYPIFSKNVSPETALAAYRELRTVKEGDYGDMGIHVSTTIDAPNVSHYIKVSNHSRTLRAFLTPNLGGSGIIYVEQARPHKFFTIVGLFSVLPETVSMSWTGPNTLVFYGTAFDGKFMRYELNLHTGEVALLSVNNLPRTAEQTADALVGE